MRQRPREGTPTCCWKRLTGVGLAETCRSDCIAGEGLLEFVCTVHVSFGGSVASPRALILVRARARADWWSIKTIAVQRGTND